MRKNSLSSFHKPELVNEHFLQINNILQSPNGLRQLFNFEGLTKQMFILWICVKILLGCCIFKSQKHESFER